MKSQNNAPRVRAVCDVFTLSVGNTHTQLVSWRHKRIVARQEWLTSAPPCGLVATLRAAKAAPVVIAGVVPAYRARLSALLRKHGQEVLVFRKDLKPRIEIVPRPPERVGDDRIAGAMGALALDARRPWVIVDVGTAMTINAVTPSRGTKAPRFEGGLIVPGAAAALRALSDNTAQLPRLNPSGTLALTGLTFIGRSTEAAMGLGVLHAQVLSAFMLAEGQKRELGPGTRIILTGGGTADVFMRTLLLESFPRGTAKYVPDLVHLGLFSVWQESCARRQV